MHECMNEKVVVVSRVAQMFRFLSFFSVKRLTVLSWKTRLPVACNSKVETTKRKIALLSSKSAGLKHSYAFNFYESKRYLDEN